MDSGLAAVMSLKRFVVGTKWLGGQGPKGVLGKGRAVHGDGETRDIEAVGWFESLKEGNGRKCLAVPFIPHKGLNQEGDSLGRFKHATWQVASA